MMSSLPARNAAYESVSGIGRGRVYYLRKTEASFAAPQHLRAVLLEFIDDLEPGEGWGLHHARAGTRDT